MARSGAACCCAGPAWEWRTPPIAITACARPSRGTPRSPKLAREHNDANVLVLPARFVSDDDGVAILKAWLDTPFEGGRHQRRVDKIDNDGHRTRNA